MNDSHNAPRSSRSLRWQPRPTPLDGLLLLVLLSAIVGLVISADQSASWPRFWRLLLGLALYIALAHGLSTRQRCLKAGQVLVVGGVALALVTLLGAEWTNTRLAGQPMYERLPSLLRDPLDGAPFNPRVMGMGLAMLVPLPLAFALLSPSSQLEASRRIWMGVAAAFMILVLLLTQSLQGVLGFAAAVLFLLVWRSRWLLLLILSALALGVLALLLLPAPVTTRQFAIDTLSVNHPIGAGVVLRLDMWSRALAMLRDMPFTGIGLNAYPVTQSQFYIGLLLGPEPHAHNLFLQIALDLGLLGLLAFTALVVVTAGLFFSAWRRRSGDPLEPVLAGAAGGLVAYLASGLIDAPWASKPGILLWVLLGVTVAVCRLLTLERDEKAGTFPTRGPQFVLPLLLLTAFALALLAFPARRALNWSLVHAHRTLVSARAMAEHSPAPADALDSAARRLADALARAPAASPPAWRTLASIYAWLGEDERALLSLEQAVNLDLPDAGQPLLRYAPFEAWRRDLEDHLTDARGRLPWQDLVWVYNHWMNRFPKRAEGYVQVAWVQDHFGNAPDQAVATLQQGLTNGAQPEGLLHYALARLQGQHPAQGTTSQPAPDSPLVPTPPAPASSPQPQPATATPQSLSGIGTHKIQPYRRRFGVCVANGPLTDYPVEELGIGWWLNWSVEAAPPATGDGDDPQSSQPSAFWQMVWVSEDGYSPEKETLQAVARANPGSHWLIGNEPDVPWQGNTTPETYARLYHELYHLLKAADPASQVAIAGVSQPTPLRLAYLDRVLAAYESQFGQPVPVDLWNVHNFILREERGSWGVDIPPGFQENSGELYEIDQHDDLEIFKQQIVDFRRWMAERGQQDRPLVVSEYGVLMPPDYGFDLQRVQAFMLGSFDYFLTARDPLLGYPADENRLVQWWAWYSLDDTLYPTGNLFDPQTGAITPLGTAFARYQPPTGAPQH